MVVIAFLCLAGLARQRRGMVLGAIGTQEVYARQKTPCDFFFTLLATYITRDGVDLFP